MEKKEILRIAEWASQPRQRVWRNWLVLLSPLGVPLVDIRRDYQPSMRLICEPLLGRVITEGDVRSVALPPFSERKAIYAEALDIIAAFKAYDELLQLATYRRQVENDEPLPELDQRFLDLVYDAGPSLSDLTTKKMLQRMPPGTPIHEALLEILRVRAQVLLLLAAE